MYEKICITYNVHGISKEVHLLESDIRVANGQTRKQNSLWDMCGHNSQHISEKVKKSTQYF